MGIKTSVRSITVRYFAACLLFFIIAIRFYFMGDQIGTAIYTFTTGASLVVAFARLAKRD